MKRNAKHRTLVTKKNYVVVRSRSYGNRLKGTKIYFEGPRPKMLQKDGSIKCGKHILEMLMSKFGNFRWIITKDANSIEKKWNITRVKTSLRLLGEMFNEERSRSRDIKNSIVQHFFSITFPEHFKEITTKPYIADSFARLLEGDIVLKLSSNDRDALRNFLPDFIASETVGSVKYLKATSEIKSLKGLVRNFEGEINRGHGESWWQEYIKANILLMQQGYVKALNKINVTIGNTKYPDFSLITHDNYLDILEIKKPDTRILKEDTSRGNYYWDIEVSKAIIQTENYIEEVNRNGDALRSHLLDKYKLNAKTLRPRGIILVGNSHQFASQKQKDDFRLLSQGIKNVTILTYDELLTRLKNFISVLEDLAKKA